MDFNEIKNIKIKKEEENLSKYACKSVNGKRKVIEEDVIRLSFERDTDRIIHSLAYTRYMGKTQVFSYVNNDNISKRMVHVQFVSKISRTIGRNLNLNTDLIEAIALGHDIGHTPLGHVGEAILNRISLRELNECFMHNVQSVRELVFLDNKGTGANLTYQVLDGILCHNGEVLCNKYEPIAKTIDEFFDEYERCYKDKDYSLKIRPHTLEGCVVRICDIVAYIGRDIEDAISLKVIKREDIPKDIKEVLGDNNKTIINNIVLDIIKNSYDKPYIMMSDRVFKAINSLKDFNYNNIYNKANSKEAKDEYEIAFNTVYSKYLNDLEYNNKDSQIYKDFLDDMNDIYLINTSNKRKVIDFIAGMTDIYFYNCFDQIRK